MATTINALVFDSFGGPEKIHIAPITKPEIKNNNDILVKVKAASVNPSDFLYMSGSYPIKPASYPAQLGYEGSGIIDAVGKGITNLKVGQRVHFASMSKIGSWSEYILLNDKDIIVPLSDKITFEQGAQLFVNPLTVKAIFIELGLKKAAASALGRIVISLAKELGVITINVVRRDEHIEPLKALGADYVINSEKEDVGIKAKEFIPGGVKYAIGPISGKSGGEVLKALADKGTYLIFGSIAGPIMEILVPIVIANRLTLVGFTLRKWGVEHASKLPQLYNELLESIENKTLQLTSKSFDAKSEFQEAFKHSTAPGKSEKTVLLFN